MRAAYMLNGRMAVGEVPDPVPQTGHVLVRTSRCGLCASDAHFLADAESVVATSKKYGGPYSHLDLGQVIVPGHEYVAEIVDYGPGSARPLPLGTRVTSQPVVRSAGGHSIVGQSHDCPGGFGEYMLLDETALMAIPDEVDDDRAALIEPLAVGLEHARVGAPTPGDVPLVIGCGAIGLGVIAGLRLMGHGPIVAADFDPNRRAVAVAMGADVAIDPQDRSPYEPIADIGRRRANLIYECVGTPGMLGQIINSLPFEARLVVGGFCLVPEELYVPAAQMRRLTINFAAGEEQQDLDLAMRSIAEGTIDVTSWIGARIGLNGVAAALKEMRNASAPVRTVVDPRQLG